MEHGIDLVCFLDPERRTNRVLNLPVIHELATAPEVDAWLSIAFQIPQFDYGVCEGYWGRSACWFPLSWA